MNFWSMLFWVGLAAAAALGCYGLDRFFLYLERRDLLYYRHKKPTGGGGGAFVAMQQIIEPSVHHVVEINEERLAIERDDEGDPRDPSPSRTDHGASERGAR